MEEIKRSLAHVEKIVAIEPIPGADFICKASILGWELCVKKDEFKVGDLAVYIEVDSVCDVTDPRFEFLKDTKGRVKIRKFKKQISMGLALPMSILPPTIVCEEGSDVTEILMLRHYDPESPLNQKEAEFKPQNGLLKFLLRFWIGRKIILPFIRKPRGAWPAWVVKTDECRIQNIPSILQRNQDKKFYVTEKIDYQSVTFFTRKVKVAGVLSKKIFGVCSRNQWIKTENDSLYWKVARKYDLERILKNCDEELTIQGEQGDVGVQKNKYGISGPRFWVFNIIDNRTGRHFSLEEMEMFCERHGLEMVPVLDRNFQLPLTVDEMVKYSIGKSVVNPKVEREGVVVRLIEDGQKKISFKCISPNFLLKHDE